MIREGRSDLLRVVVTGASGRMGGAVREAITRRADMVLVGVTDTPSAALVLTASAGVPVCGTLAELAVAMDVVVDFTAPAACVGFAKEAAQLGVAFVSGTTGLGAADHEALAAAAARVPLLWAPNMARGVHVLAKLVEMAARALGDDFDPEIIEVHHRQKADAPSGTALRLADAARAGRELRAVYGRSGRPGARGADEIGIHAVRCGGVVGDHTVVFGSRAERLELVHRAHGREMFAEGALDAARYIVGRPPGRYTMEQVFGLQS